MMQSADYHIPKHRCDPSQSRHISSQEEHPFTRLSRFGRQSIMGFQKLLAVYLENSVQLHGYNNKLSKVIPNWPTKSCKTLPPHSFASRQNSFSQELFGDKYKFEAKCPPNFTYIEIKINHMPSSRLLVPAIFKTLRKLHQNTIPAASLVQSQVFMSLDALDAVYKIRDLKRNG